MPRFSLSIILVASLVPLAHTLADAGPPPSLVAFVRTHCVDCHAGDAAEGALDLAALSWSLDTIHDRVKHGEMPPADADQPTAEDRAAVVAALAGALRVHDAAAKRKGDKPVRYKLGLPVDPSSLAPGGTAFDDIHGFRTILLADRERLARNLTEHLLVYATGAGIRFADREVVSGMLEVV